MDPKMKLREMEDTNRTPGWHARSTEYPCQAWAPMQEDAVEALRKLVAKHKTDLAAKSSTSKFHDMDALVKAAGLPELFNTPCAEHWENEAEYNFEESCILRDEEGEIWIDFNDETWDRITPVLWTETEGTRALPPTQIKSTLRHEDDYWVWESGYTAVLETFTETAKYVPDVGTVYMCEATYTYEGDCTSKAKQWKV